MSTYWQTRLPFANYIVVTRDGYNVGHLSQTSEGVWSGWVPNDGLFSLENKQGFILVVNDELALVFSNHREVIDWRENVFEVDKNFYS